MSEIDTLREMRPAAPPAELDAMCMAARERFVAGTGPKRAGQRWRRPVLAGGLTAAAAATAAATLVLTSGAGTVPARHGTTGHTGTVVTAAWTVREDADGTVTIYLQQYANPGALQQTLRADGINAIVREIPTAVRRAGNLTIPVPTCNYTAVNNAEPRAVQRAVWTIAGQDLPARFIIHPDAMPQGSALFLAFMANVPTPKPVAGTPKPLAGTLGPKNGGTGIVALKPVVLNNDTVPACVPAKKVPMTPANTAG
jgi:hypothetical protein